MCTIEKLVFIWSYHLVVLNKFEMALSSISRREIGLWHSNTIDHWQVRQSRVRMKHDKSGQMCVLCVSMRRGKCWRDQIRWSLYQCWLQPPCDQLCVRAAVQSIPGKLEDGGWVGVVSHSSRILLSKLSSTATTGYLSFRGCWCRVCVIYMLAWCVLCMAKKVLDNR